GMAATSRKSASSWALSCNRFFRKKLIGMSISPPCGEPNASSTMRMPRYMKIRCRTDAGSVVAVTATTSVAAVRSVAMVMAWSRGDREIGDGRMLSAERIVLTPAISQRLEPHGAGVDHQQAPDQPLAEADDLADHFERHHRAEHAGQRAEDAGLRARWHG